MKSLYNAVQLNSTTHFNLKMILQIELTTEHYDLPAGRT